MKVFCITNFEDPYLSEFSIFFKKLNGFRNISTRATKNTVTFCDDFFWIDFKNQHVYTYVPFHTNMSKLGKVVKTRIFCILYDPYLKNQKKYGPKNYAKRFISCVRETFIKPTSKQKMTIGKVILCQNATFEKVICIAFPCFSFIFLYFLCVFPIYLFHIYHGNRVYIRHMCAVQLTVCEHGC